jgi:hypothetical protein
VRRKNDSGKCRDRMEMGGITLVRSTRNTDEEIEV